MKAIDVVLLAVMVFCLAPIVACILGALIWYPFGHISADADEQMAAAALLFLDEVVDEN